MRDEMTLGRIQLDLMDEMVPDAMSDPEWWSVGDLAAKKTAYSRRSVYEALTRLASKGCLNKSDLRGTGGPVAYRVTQKGIDAYQQAIFIKRRVPDHTPMAPRKRRDWHMGDPRTISCRDSRFVCYDRLSGEYWLGDSTSGHMFFHGTKPSLGPHNDWPDAWIWFPFPNAPKGRTFWVK